MGQTSYKVLGSHESCGDLKSPCFTKRIGNSDFSNVTGEKEKSSSWQLGASLHSSFRSLSVASRGPGTIS